ncbi:DNA-binding response regulator [Ammoniphilus sp. YIM 78166]|uniref:DNA-binding response regulator n=1 Tax=Ammoniphilus sp. YIM 78166 TaxID=1644106 RepID=UPI00106F58CD|nr:DNA-binding response regulator [Ammoniphilus sp. YIM 78166]
MGFEEEYGKFLNRHVLERTGERRRRVEEGLGNAEKMFLEKVWWPLFQHFDYLHPEYEIDDFKDGKRYLDFAYIRPTLSICIEIDGYGPHFRNVSRWQFSDNLERQNDLMIDGWFILRFSYDLVNDRPRRCQQTIQQMMGRLLAWDDEMASLSSFERDVVRLAVQAGDIRPCDVEKWLKVSDKTVKKILGGLVDKKLLVPSSGKVRVTSYRLREQVRLRL